MIESIQQPDGQTVSVVRADVTLEQVFALTATISELRQQLGFVVEQGQAVAEQNEQLRARIAELTGELAANTAAPPAG